MPGSQSNPDAKHAGETKDDKEMRERMEASASKVQVHGITQTTKPPGSPEGLSSLESDLEAALKGGAGKSSKRRHSKRRHSKRKHSHRRRSKRKHSKRKHSKRKHSHRRRSKRRHSHRRR